MAADQLEEFRRGAAAGAVQEDTQLGHQQEADEEVPGVLLVAAVLRVNYPPEEVFRFSFVSVFGRDGGGAFELLRCWVIFYGCTTLQRVLINACCSNNSINNSFFYNFCMT